MKHRDWIDAPDPRAPWIAAAERDHRHPHSNSPLPGSPAPSEIAAPVAAPSVRIRRVKGPLTTPPEGWTDRVIVLWTEDECLRSDPDAEHADGAWKRLFGQTAVSTATKADQVDVCDAGDSIWILYRNGRVLINACDGSSIGVLAEVVP